MNDPANWNGGFPWFTAKDLKSFYLSESLTTLTNKGAQSGTRVVSEGTVLVLVRGMTLLKDVPVGVTTRTAAFNQDLKALEPKAFVDGVFLAAYLSDRKAKLRTYVSQAGHGTGRLSTDTLQAFPVPVPPLDEQRRIVAVLSVWDRGIDQLERLIAAKKQRKRALMQQLLTGIRRFPEYVKSRKMHETLLGHIAVDWPVTAISQVFRRIRRKNGQTTDLVLTASGELGLVDQRTFFARNVAGDSLEGYYLLKRGEFAYNRSSMNGYPYGAIKRLDAHESGAVSTLYHCFALADKNSCSDFFTHLFELGLLNRQLRRICQVGGRAHGLLNVTAGDFETMVVPVPEEDEQRRIAGVLNACDVELEQLRAQLVASKQQKKGLMQKLLTGQVRVKPAGGSRNE